MVNHQPLPETHRNRIAAVIRAKGGKSQAARIFECSRSSIKTAVEGGNIHPWLADRIAKAIAKRDAEGKQP
jgi:hypothetical protein